MSDRLAKRKKRRRTAFWVFFTVIVLAGVGAGAALVGSGSDDSSSSTGPTSSTASTGVTGSTGPTASTSGSSRRGKNPTTTTTEFAIPVFGSYKVTDGVNIRSGPGTTFPVLGTVEIGFEVLVVCVTNGETVTGPLGPTNKWLRVTYKELNGYVTIQYVSVGTAINDPSVIGTCRGT